MSDVDKLGTVERYFVEVKGIPRLAERIRCFIFSRTYAATRARVRAGLAPQAHSCGCHAFLPGSRCSPPVSLLRLCSSCGTTAALAEALAVHLACLQCVDHLEVVRAACSELQACASFSKLLQAVLELGNHMNQAGLPCPALKSKACEHLQACSHAVVRGTGSAGRGMPWESSKGPLSAGNLPLACGCLQGTQRGAAAGFKLDTLLKLADVKGTDRKTSLLHFVIMQASCSRAGQYAGLPLQAVAGAAGCRDGIPLRKPLNPGVIRLED